MTIRHLTVLASLVFAAVLALGAPATARADIVHLLDQDAADVTATKWWNGKAPKMKALRGRVIVLHVSRPGQITSAAFIPKLKALASRYADQKFTLIEVAVGVSEAEVDDYVKGSDVTWLVGVDTDALTSTEYAGSSVPRTYLIGPDGKVAFHAHVNLFKPDVMDPQFRRVPFFDKKSLPKKAQKMAEFAAKLQFGKAVELADKLKADKYADDETKRLADLVREELSRYFDFQWKVLEKAIYDFDWASAWHRAEQMKKSYKGTKHQAQIDKKHQELADNPRVPANVNAMERLGKLIRKTNLKRAKALESAIRELVIFEDEFKNMLPAEKAKEWREEFQRLLNELD